MLPAVDRHDGDYYGYSTDIDTHYCAVGAPFQDFGAGATMASSSSSADYKEDAGAVYVHQRFGADWEFAHKLIATDRAPNDHFGWSLSTSGLRVAVGSPRSDLDENGGNPLTNAGSVYLFKWSGSQWVHEVKIVAPDREANDEFGFDVEISGSDLFVSARWEDHDANQSNSLTNAGSVYHFVLSSGQWVFHQKIVASDRAPNCEFGSSISIEGSVLAVGARFAQVGSNVSQGASYVFAKSSGTWIEQAKLVANDGQANDQFGTSVGISQNRIAVGSPMNNSGRGAAYLFEVNAGSWTQVQKLNAIDAQPLDRYGVQVALYRDTLVVGAPGEDHNVSGLSTSTTAQHGYTESTGSVYVNYYSGGQWQQSNKVAFTQRDAYSEYGSAIALFESDIAVGGPLCPDGTISPGRATIVGKDKYVWIGGVSSDPTVAGNWQEAQIPPTDHEYIVRSGLYQPIFSSSCYAYSFTVWNQASATFEPGTVLSVQQALANRGQIKLEADATGYASLFVKGGYSGFGKVRQEQLINGLGWHQIGSPMLGGWPSLTGGDSTKLVPWEEQVGQYGTQGSLTTEPGRGFFAQIGSGNYGSGLFAGSSTTIAVEGVPRTSIDYEIGYANNPNPTNAVLTTNVTDGWNLITNPFTCPLDFVYLSRARIDGSFTVWDPTLNGGIGGYGYYSPTGGTLSRYIAPFQAFWVRAQNATADIAPTTMAISGTISTLPGFLKRQVHSIELEIEDLDSTLSDQLWISAMPGSSAGVVDLERDAVKRENPLGAPQIEVMLGGISLAAKGIDPSEVTRLNVAFRVPLSDDLEWNIRARLVDTSNGLWTLWDRTAKQGYSLAQNAVHKLDTASLRNHTWELVRTPETFFESQETPSWLGRLSSKEKKVTYVNTDQPSFLTIYAVSGKLLYCKDLMPFEQAEAAVDEEIIVITIRRDLELFSTKLGL